MTKSNLWKMLCARNTAFSDQNAVLKIRVSEIRRLVEQSYDAGRKSVPDTPLKKMLNFLGES